LRFITIGLHAGQENEWMISFPIGERCFDDVHKKLVSIKHAQLSVENENEHIFDKNDPKKTPL
jgi:hemerythrin